MVNIQGI